MKILSYIHTPPVRKFNISLLIIFISIDLTFMLLDIFHRLGYTNDSNFSIATDRGYSEIFQYLKFIFASLSFTVIFAKTHQYIYLICSLLFIYLFLDDSLKIHEVAGSSLATWAGEGSYLGLRSQDFGELVVSAFAGLLFFVPGLLAYRFSDPIGRSLGLCVLFGIILLAFFGIAMDIVHIAMDGLFFGSNTIFRILEDGGEMIVSSLMIWVVLIYTNHYYLSYKSIKIN